MRHLDLFSGIGGFALPARWMGWQTVQFVERELYAQAVLRKHWPDTPLHGDISTFDGSPFKGSTEILTGGFPCQDLSKISQTQEGIFGQRSGLWYEFYRVLNESRPNWVVIENVPTLRNLGADLVLSDLAKANYAAWPLVVGACHTNAPHRRQRVWIIGCATDWAQTQETDAIAAIPRQQLLEGVVPNRTTARPARRAGRKYLYRPDWEWWTDAPEPAVCSLDDGVPGALARHRVNSLRALGNSVVPQVVYSIYCAIQEVDDALLSLQCARKGAASTYHGNA
jgi:DNA (cytosine-5)-methyltransferase 1